MPVTGGGGPRPARCQRAMSGTFGASGQNASVLSVAQVEDLHPSPELRERRAGSPGTRGRQGLPPSPQAIAGPIGAGLDYADVHPVRLSQFWSDLAWRVVGSSSTAALCYLASQPGRNRLPARREGRAPVSAPAGTRARHEGCDNQGEYGYGHGQAGRGNKRPGTRPGAAPGQHHDAVHDAGGS